MPLNLDATWPRWLEVCGILERNKISGPTAPESCGEEKKTEPFWPCIYQSCSQDDDLDGVNSNIFWNFHPELWGKIRTQFDGCIFFKGGVGSTTKSWLETAGGAAAAAEGGAAKQVGEGVREGPKGGKNLYLRSFLFG